MPRDNQARRPARKIVSRNVPRSAEQNRSDKVIVFAAFGTFTVMWFATLLFQENARIWMQNYQILITGVILLGLNAARYWQGLQMSRFTLIAGFLLIAYGGVREALGEFSIVAGVVAVVVSVLLVEFIGRSLPMRRPPAR